MKYMKVLETVKLKDINDRKIVDENGQNVEISFKQFIVGRLSDPKFSVDFDMVMSAYRIKQAMDGCENGTLSLETMDWQKLVEVVKKPSAQTPYHPLYAINLVPFMREIINAEDVDNTGNN